MANDAYVFSLPLLPGITVQNLLYGSLAVALVAILSMSSIYTGDAAAELIFAAVGVFFARSRKSSKGRIVLLVGDEDAGKTTILSTVRLCESLCCIPFLTVSYSS